MGLPGEGKRFVATLLPASLKEGPMECLLHDVHLGAGAEYTPCAEAMVHP